MGMKGKKGRRRGVLVIIAMSRKRFWKKIEINTNRNSGEKKNQKYREGPQIDEEYLQKNSNSSHQFHDKFLDLHLTPRGGRIQSTRGSIWLSFIKLLDVLVYTAGEETEGYRLNRKKELSCWWIAWLYMETSPAHNSHVHMHIEAHVHAHRHAHTPPSFEDIKYTFKKSTICLLTHNERGDVEI